MKTTKHELSPPSLEELVATLKPALKANYNDCSISIDTPPDLSKAPFHLASSGISGNEAIADIGGQANLAPRPNLQAKYDLVSIARDDIGMSSEQGLLIGAGAGPFHVLGQNSELAPNVGWTGSFDHATNCSHVTKINKADNDKIKCEPCPSTDCGLMCNLFCSSGLSGPVLKITARGRKGEGKSFTEHIRQTLKEAYGDRPVSLGGVFIIKSGKARFHVMPDFPPKAKLPFRKREDVENWLTYHTFSASEDSPIVCLTTLHSADPGLGLRMEHTHCFTTDGSGRGGHYHYDLVPEERGEEVEYEAYLNTAKAIYRVDRPDVKAIVH